MSLTPEELIQEYTSLMKSIDYITQASVMAMIIASTWFLWIPRYIRQLPYSGLSVFFMASGLLLVGLFLMRRLLVKPTSNFRYILYTIILGGVIYQQILDIFTLFPIIIISLAAVIISLTSPILEQTERTQHFSSSHKVSEEVLIAIQQSYVYISERRNWLFNIIILQIILSVTIIIGFTLTNLVTIFLDLLVLQYVFLGIFLVLISMLILTIFPKIDKKDEYELYIEGNI